jgi:hypothetical protein
MHEYQKGIDIRALKKKLKRKAKPIEVEDEFEGK